MPRSRPLRMANLKKKDKVWANHGGKWYEGWIDELNTREKVFKVYFPEDGTTAEYSEELIGMIRRRKKGGRPPKLPKESEENEGEEAGEGGGWGYPVKKKKKKKKIIQ